MENEFIGCLIYCWILRDGTTHFDRFGITGNNAPFVEFEGNLKEIDISKDKINHLFRVYLKGVNNTLIK